LEYVEKGRTSSEIAADFGITDNAICFWLAKHKIPGRAMSEIRRHKHWGAAGEKNPMYGRVGVLNPHWKGGHTPLRQSLYANPEWRKAKRAVRYRDKHCRLCGSMRQPEYHHITPFSEAPLLVFDVGNLILLCRECHLKLKGKENRWRKILYALIEEGGANPVWRLTTTTTL
jgi:hypothetical protein